MLEIRKLAIFLQARNQLNHPGLSRIEQECHESLIYGMIHIQQNSNKGLEYW